MSLLNVGGSGGSATSGAIVTQGVNVGGGSTGYLWPAICAGIALLIVVLLATRKKK
jgi:hypothetical protein